MTLVVLYLIVGFTLSGYWTCYWGDPGFEGFLAASIAWPVILLLAAAGEI